jgi:hypothetical protein
MAATFGLVYPPWNHTTRPDGLLERAAGEVGIDHLTVPVIAGERTQFRLWGGYESPHFHTEGGWHYPPQAKRYGSCGVRPRPARWCGTRDVLADIRGRADQLGLRLVLRIELGRIRPLVEHTPELRCRNAWGDELLAYGPCVCSSSFRELLRASLADLARYEPAGFELASPTLNPAWLGAGPDPGRAPLASCCFCAACRQIAAMAGIDADAAAQEVRAAVERLAQAETDAGRAAEITSGVLAQYERAREEDRRSWLVRLAETLAGRTVHLKMRLSEGVPGWPDPEGRRELRGLYELEAGWLSSAGREWFSESLRRIPGPKGLAMHVLVHCGGATPAEELVRRTSAAAADGVDYFDFEGLEEAPTAAVTWLRQAVRYARRGS